MNPTGLKLLIGAVVLLCASMVKAQAFAGGAASAFTPEIGVVQSGAVNDVQATVSADEKYVTLTMRPSLSRLISLRSFTFQQGAGVGRTALGYVGLPPNPGAAARQSSGHSMPWTSAHSFVPVLQRQGMMMICIPTTQPTDARK